MNNVHRLGLAALSVAGVLLFQGTSPIKKTDDPKPVVKPVNIPRYIAAADTGKWQFPCDEASIKKYTAYRVSKAPVIDGKLDEEFWQKVPKSPRFTDLVSGRETIHDTRAAIGWDDENLYIAFWVEEPFTYGTFKNHNDLIYKENDIEVFIAGKNAYYEFELNALNTRYEAFFMWKDTYEKNNFAANPAFKVGNPLMRDFNGVGLKNHPRGMRFGSWDFKFPGMQSAVQIDGTLNDNKDRDRGWTVELAFPWKGMDWIMRGDGRPVPPKNDDIWRIDFTRFNPYKEAPPAKDNGGWAWSPHGVWDSHVPECFPIITFSTKGLQ